MDRRAMVEDALREGRGLPAAPVVLGRIAELCKDPEATARDLGKVLQYDTALTNRVLKQVNSSFYGLSATIKTVTHAVVILGFQEIRSIVLSVPVANLYQDGIKKPGIDVDALWNASVEWGCVARILAYHVRHPVPEQVFVAAMLGDTGMVVMNNLLGDEYAAVVGGCDDEDFLPEVETAELGINHIEVGERIGQKWHFPEDLVEAMSRHHDPIDGEGNYLRDTALLYVAARLRSGAIAGDPFDAILAGIPEAFRQEFDLTPESLAEAQEKASREYDEAKRMLAQK